MEEKIIESKRYNSKIILIASAVSSAVFGFFAHFVITIPYLKREYWRIYTYAQKYGNVHKIPTEGKWIRNVFWNDGYFWRPLIAILIPIVIGVILFFWLRSYEMIITDKRVYGKKAFGIRVDLPLDSISAIGMKPLMKGISVATSSGRISFIFFKNSKEMYEKLNNLLMKRQDYKKTFNQSELRNNTVYNDEPRKNDDLNDAKSLEKYKDLLDKGIITQEEFNAKKKQILGL